MSRSIVVTPRAKQDIFDIADYIAEQSLDAAMRFLDQVEASFQRLLQMPELGAICQTRHSETVGVRV